MALDEAGVEEANPGGCVMSLCLASVALGGGPPEHQPPPSGANYSYSWPQGSEELEDVHQLQEEKQYINKEKGKRETDGEEEIERETGEKVRN